MLSGRHRTNDVSVRADEAARHIPALVIAYVLALGAATVALGFLAAADGAGHPTTAASVVVGVALVLGGPDLVAWAQRRGGGAAA